MKYRFYVTPKLTNEIKVAFSHKITGKFYKIFFAGYYSISLSSDFYLNKFLIPLKNFFMPVVHVLTIDPKKFATFEIPEDNFDEINLSPENSLSGSQYCCLKFINSNFCQFYERYSFFSPVGLIGWKAWEVQENSLILTFLIFEKNLFINYWCLFKSKFL